MFKISVAIVVYNSVSTIEETIKSVLNQTYNNIELIIIDGQSIDGTVSILEKYNENIVYWHSKKDSGIYDAMNQAQDVASGDFIIFLGSDDVFYNPDVISSFVNLINYKNAVYYGDVYMSNDKKLYDGVFTTIRLALQCFSHQSIFYPKDVYKKYKYNTKYKYAADYDLNMRVWSSYGHFKRLELTTVLFNQNGLGSLNEDAIFLKDKLSITYNTLGLASAAIVFLQRLKLRILGKGVVFNFYR